MNLPNFKTCQQATGAVQMGRPVLCGRRVAPGSDYCQHHHQLHEYNAQYWALHKESTPTDQRPLR